MSSSPLPPPGPLTARVGLCVGDTQLFPHEGLSGPREGAHVTTEHTHRQRTLFREEAFCNPFSLLCLLWIASRASAVTPSDQASSPSPLMIPPGEARVETLSVLGCRCVHAHLCIKYGDGRSQTRAEELGAWETRGSSSALVSSTLESERG